MGIRWGYCAGCDKADGFKAAGWDFIEGNIVGLLQGTQPASEWTGAETVSACGLPVPSANSMVPAALKITGPEVDAEKLSNYLINVMLRAKQVGINTLVFGSGGARNVPDEFDRTKARGQILSFLSTAATLAEQAGVTIVAEPLNRKESNILNSVAEAMEYVDELKHPNFQCLVDSYHFWLEDEPLSHLEAAMGSIKHVHLADKVGRTAPGLSGQSDYKPFFHVLKSAGYGGLISVEAGDTAKIIEANQQATILEYLRTHWDAA